MQRKDGALDLRLSLKLAGSSSDWAHLPERKKRSLSLISEGSPSEFQFRDWAHLPGEAVQLISDKVKSIRDYFRFRAVCSPWRSASFPKPRHLPPQLPWLMFPWGRRDRKNDGIRHFYDLWEGTMRKLYLPGTMHTTSCASYRGWLLLESTIDEKVFLLNPLTWLRIHLPPFATPVKRSEANWDDPLYQHSWCHPDVGTFAIRKVIFSAEPTNPNCLITVFPRNDRGFLCCRVRDLCWTRIMGGRVSRPLPWYTDATYYNGRFFLLYKDAMEIIDSNKPEERIVFLLEPELAYVSKFLLEGKSGVYVVVPVHETSQFLPGAAAQMDENDPVAHDAKEDAKKCPKQKIELYKFHEQLLKLKKVTDTRNTIIFCRHHVDPYLAVCSDDWDSLEGGSMYMVRMSLYEYGPESSYCIDTAKLDDGEFKLVWSEAGKELQFCSSAQPMWFQPSFV